MTLEWADSCGSSPLSWQVWSSHSIGDCSPRTDSSWSEWAASVHRNQCERHWVSSSAISFSWHLHHQRHPVYLCFASSIASISRSSPSPLPLRKQFSEAHSCASSQSWLTLRSLDYYHLILSLGSFHLAYELHPQSRDQNLFLTLPYSLRHLRGLITLQMLMN